MVKKQNNSGLKELEQRLQQNKPTYFYLTCCSEAHPNRFSYSPAAESRLLGWVPLKYNLTGYVDWAYNSWPKNVYQNPVFNYPQVDEYFVYPGKNGEPASSIRWELLRDGIEDFELVKQLKESGKNMQFRQIIDSALQNFDSPKKDIKDIYKARKMLLKSEE